MSIHDPPHDAYILEVRLIAKCQLACISLGHTTKLEDVVIQHSCFIDHEDGQRHEHVAFDPSLVVIGWRVESTHFHYA